MQITTIGLDLAKHVFQVHGVDEDEGVVEKRRLRRGQVLSYFAKLRPCLVGMEACATAHFWARELIRLGHEVRLVPPQYVKAYLKRGKNDAADAAAICEAVRRLELGSNSRRRSGAAVKNPCHNASSASRLSLASRLPGTKHLDCDVQVTLNEFDGIGSCSHGGIDQGPASADIKLPAVPGTPDDLTLPCIGEGAVRRFGCRAADRPLAKSCSAMRTDILQGEVVSLDPEYTDGSLLQFDDLGGPLRHLVRPAGEDFFLCQGSPLTRPRRQRVGAGACRRSGHSVP